MMGQRLRVREGWVVLFLSLGLGLVVSTGIASADWTEGLHILPIVSLGAFIIGLMLAKSGATGFEGLTVEDGVATLKLKGGCTNEGGVHSIYDLIVPTLKQFDEIDAVKVLDPEGETQNPDGKGDSRPACLEP